MYVCGLDKYAIWLWSVENTKIYRRTKSRFVYAILTKDNILNCALIATSHYPLMFKHYYCNVLRVSFSWMTVT